MTAAAAMIERYSFGGLLLAAVLVVSTIITPVLAQPPWATSNWVPGDRGGGGRWWTGSYGTQSQGEAGGGGGGGGSPPPPHHGPGVVSSGTPRLGRAFKIFSVRPEGAKCNVDLYCNGCNWNDAYCTGSMTVIASDPACERACACVVSGCPPRENP
ncbi:hypothetical protein PGQ11_012341 [Apiospora arundinis]|uniref:Uncharacterized protein n=1 Tax=Apiospora arundinis TaxID=335852 RepID=A0ABR2I230_9PEZI